MSVVEPPAESPALSHARHGRVVRGYVAMGDSFTAGRESIEAERWADRLADSLRAVNPELAYANLAVDGATSAEVLEQIPAALEVGPDLVTVICGANDVLLTSRPDIEGYERRFGEILARLREADPETSILTATAPESWHFMDLRPRTMARVERALTELNEVTRRVAAQHLVPCLAVAGHPDLTDRANYAPDGLHPSAIGHERVAEEIALSLRAHFGIEGERRGGGSR